MKIFIIILQFLGLISFIFINKAIIQREKNVANNEFDSNEVRQLKEKIKKLETQNEILKKSVLGNYRIRKTINDKKVYIPSDKFSLSVFRESLNSLRKVLKPGIVVYSKDGTNTKIISKGKLKKDNKSTEGYTQKDVT